MDCTYHEWIGCSPSDHIWQTDDESISLGVLPEKTAYCNEKCNRFLRESADQLQIAMVAQPMVVLGVELCSLAENEYIIPKSGQNISMCVFITFYCSLI